MKGILNAEAFIAQFKQQASAPNIEQMLAVQAIIDDVKANGDQALAQYTEHFDGQTLDKVKVTPEQLKASWDALDTDLQDALKLTKARIEQYEQRILYQDNLDEELSYVYRPLARVGLYVPGGTAL